MRFITPDSISACKVIVDEMSVYQFQTVAFSYGAVHILRTQGRGERLPDFAYRYICRGREVLRKCTCTDNKIKCLILPSTYVFIAIIAIAVVRLHILLVIEMFVMLTDDEYDGSDH